MTNEHPDSWGYTDDELMEHKRHKQSKFPEYEPVWECPTNECRFIGEVVQLCKRCEIAEKEHYEYIKGYQ